MKRGGDVKNHPVQHISLAGKLCLMRQMHIAEGGGRHRNLPRNTWRRPSLTKMLFIAAVGNFNRCHSLSQVQVVIRMNTEDTNTAIDCDIHGLDTWFRCFLKYVQSSIIPSYSPDHRKVKDSADSMFSRLVADDLVRRHKAGGRKPQHSPNVYV